MMPIPIKGVKVYNFVPNDCYKCHIGIIVEINPTEFIVQYKDDIKVRYRLEQIRNFTLHG